MRLFSALEISDEVREEISVWWSSACLYLPADQWRDVRKINWHLTLAFYGDICGDDLDDLGEALADVAADTSPLLLRTDGCGVFPRADRPRVFWVGAGMHGEETGAGRPLRYLARCCRQAGHVTLRKHTAKSEPFRGHITLARAAPDASPLEVFFWQALPEIPVLTWRVDSLNLYASQLKSQGPIYRLVEAFEFKGK